MVEVILLALTFSTPLLLAVLGELTMQRGGIINLGIEGMMLTAAMTAVLLAQTTHNTAAGLLGGIAGALLMAALFGVCTIVLRADQIVTGTAINLLALGVTGFVYREVGYAAIPQMRTDVFVTISWTAIPLALAFLLWRTTFGLRLRACGENPDAVRASGASVNAHRWAALLIEALLVGLAGAFLSLALSSGFAENMTAGRGFIALSIVIFGRWKVKGAILGTLVFGVAAALQYALQAANHGVPFHLLLAVPYIVTLLILAGVAGKVRAPESLGR
ncbi:MAG TPA: ABC transporter permease [Thermoanaerobaculia bacterium]|jgi:simple sugar transport system permease protein